jgi:hypothetical protein
LCHWLNLHGPWLYVLAGILAAFISHGYLGEAFDDVAVAAGIIGSARAAGTIGALVGLVFWAVTILLPYFAGEKSQRKRSSS